MAKSKKRKNNRKTVLILLAVLAVLFLFDIWGDFCGKSEGEIVTVTAEDGESFSDVAKKMDKEGVVKYSFLFKRYAIKNGADTSLKAGSHTMYKNMGYKRAVDELINNGTGNNTVTVTVPEGYELKEVAARVEELLGIPKDKFLKAAEKDYGIKYVKDVPKREARTEGYLFPDTYEFFRTVKPEDVVKRMLGNFENHWTDEYSKRCKELDMTVDEAVTLASIIEREAGSVSEMGKVSSVFHNRMEIGMALQSCATVQYILPERKDVLDIADTKIDSPYNTYLYPGLPKGPIANPGKAAIEAALYPEETDFYYFKVNEDGVTVFSKTLSEHNSK